MPGLAILFALDFRYYASVCSGNVDYLSMRQLEKKYSQGLESTRTIEISVFSMYETGMQKHLGAFYNCCC